MSAYTETMWSHADIKVPLENIKPMGDCVLVRVLPEEEVTASGIVLPQTGNDSSGLRIGEVIAAGPGDRLIHYWCLYYKCSSRDAMPAFDAYRLMNGKTPKCPNCGRDMEPSGLPARRRAPMHVKPGDRIWYRRVLANQQLINGELYQLIHEEAHIWAVLEN